MNSHIQRIFDELQCILTSEKGYYTQEIRLECRQPESGATYYSIEFFGQVFANFKGSKKLYMEISPTVEHLFISGNVPFSDSRSAGWKRLIAAEFSFSMFPNLPPAIYEAYFAQNGFDCCSRYMQCSDARRCLQPNMQLSRQCTYRQKLIHGIVYYGENRNV